MQEPRSGAALIRSLFFTLLLLGWAQAQSIPPASGLAGWGPLRYLVVHDTKVGKSGPRLACLNLLENSQGKITGYRHSEIPLDWTSVGGEANDLEAITPVDGLPGHFLLVESGYYQGKFGRVFWLDANQDPPRLLGQLPLPHREQEIEGLACQRLDEDHWSVFLGGRKDRLYWGQLSRSQWQVDWSEEEISIRPPQSLGEAKDQRAISDLYLDPQGCLWASACTDPEDEGPFRSLIYPLGRFGLSGQLEEQNADIHWWVEGCKIEGLAAPPKEKFGPAYVTDDESYQGIWRAVAPKR